MFFTGVAIGSVLGTVTCLAAVLLPALAEEARTRTQARPALVPLRVARPTRVSMD